MSRYDLLSLSCVDFIKLLRRVDKYFSSNLGTFQPYFLKYFFCPFLSFFSRTPIMHTGTLNGVLKVSEVYSFFFHFFPFCSSDCIISIDLSSSWLILSQIWCGVLLVTISFHFLSFFVLFIYICICIYTVSMHLLFGKTLFSNFPLVLYTWFPSVLWTFKITDLTSLSSKSYSEASSGTISTFLFSLCMINTFFFLCMAHGSYFFIGNRTF